MQRLATGHIEPVLDLGHFRAHAAQVFSDQCDAIRLLDPQFLRIADADAVPRVGSDRGKHRQLVDELRGQGAGDGGAPEAVLGRGQLHGAGKLAIALLQVEDGRLCAQRGQHIEQRGARRIEA